MPRDISATVRAVLDAQSAESHDVVIITLPLKAGETQPVVLRQAAAKGLVLNIDGQSQAFLSGLRSISQIKFSLGGNVDGAEITLENVTGVFGAELSDTSRTLDGAFVEIRRAFMTDTVSRTYETVILFEGQVRDIKVDQSLVTLTLVSDMNKKGAKLANRAVTQRCLWTFNVQGSGIGEECGWQVSQGGDPNNCEHTPEACAAHNNLHRYGGVPTLKPNPNSVVVEDTGNGGYDDFLRRSPLFDEDYRPWWGRWRGFVPSDAGLRTV